MPKGGTQLECVLMAAAERIVVVGAALAGIRAVEGARAAGWTGGITLVGDEMHLPYDRPSLSKEFLDHGSNAQQQPLVTSEWLGENDVDLVLGAQAISLNADLGTLETTTGQHEFTRAVIATGSAPVQLPGTENMRGVVSLRTVEDARRVRKALDENARIAVIGGGFIGAEVASAARRRELDVTIVEAAPVPLVRAVGSDMGAILSQMHAANGVDLRCGVGVSGFIGGDRVEAVTLADGSLIEADLVIVGIGTRPTTGWLEGSGLSIDNGVVCDANLRSSSPNVYAAGDIANWHNPLFARNMRIEHFTAAAEQGRRAGQNAANPAQAEAYSTIPYFWSDWYGNRIQFAGVSTSDFEVVSGDLNKSHFVVLYREADRLAGVLTLNGQRHVMKYRKLITEGASFHDALEYASVRMGVS